ncbi:MAG: arginine decarboxylase, pyruvoyl-dependent [Gammaproteobacteria bacterium]|nr:arginine decarboxylase, pyruvoyl-dependent [Gammaproteobacteria bacterium]
MIPNKLFLTKGAGRHREKLHSFELALRDAGIAHLNLVTVSSVLPPACDVIPKDKGLTLLSPGEITYVVLARNETSEPHRLLSASVGLAIPADKHMHGYISEHHAFGQAGEITGDYAEDLAATMLATTVGLDFDAEQAWDQRKQHYRTSELIIRTTNVTQSATGDKHGLWTTVVAAAVFAP